MKRIVFILPDQNRFSANFSTLNIPGLRLPHMGMCIIGEILRRKGYDVTVFEEKIAPVKLSDLIGKKPDLVGISIQTITASRGYQLATLAKRALKVPVVAGGTHATLNTEEVLSQDFDYVIRNEGEHAFPELLEALENNLSCDDILGLSYKDGEETYHNATRPFIEDLDSIPSPNWNLMQNLYTRKMNPMNFLIYPIQASRGCPFNCTFCSVTPCFGKKYRFRSVENVVQELKENKMPGQKFIFFYDDNICGNKKYLKELLAAFIDNKLDLSWHSQMRADVAEDPELMDLMERTHCAAGTFGFESISDDTLKEMKKGQDVDLIKNCISTMHDNHMVVNGFFVFGFENDTKQTVRDTVEFARENKVDIGGFMPLTPFPGTELGKQMEAEDRIFSRNWELYDVQHVTYYPNKMTPLELYEECIKAYPRFYHPKGRKIHAPGKKRRGLFDMFHDLWSVRAFMLFQMEWIANRRYMRYLKNLPEKRTEGMKDFLLEDEYWHLHDLLKQRFRYRNMNVIFGPPRNRMSRRRKRKEMRSS